VNRIWASLIRELRLRLMELIFGADGCWRKRSARGPLAVDALSPRHDPRIVVQRADSSTERSWFAESVAPSAFDSERLQALLLCWIRSVGAGRVVHSCRSLAPCLRPAGVVLAASVSASTASGALDGSGRSQSRYFGTVLETGWRVSRYERECVSKARGAPCSRRAGVVRAASVSASATRSCSTGPVEHRRGTLARCSIRRVPTPSSACSSDPRCSWLGRWPAGA
jgi:hypothetical protein